MRRALSSERFQEPNLHTLTRIAPSAVAPILTATLSPGPLGKSQAPLAVLIPPPPQYMQVRGDKSRIGQGLKSSPTAPLLARSDLKEQRELGMGCFGCRCGISLVRFQKWRLAKTFKSCGLVERQVDIDNQTSIHCWVSKPFAGTKEQEPLTAPRRSSLLLIHGFGASAIWQWAGHVHAFHKHFDLVIPDLIFFGESRSSSQERSERFEAASMAALMHNHFNVDRYHVAGISYGGFVAYRMAYDYPDRVRSVVLTDSPGVVMVRSDYEKMLSTHGVASTADLLLPQTTADVKRLMKLAYKRPPPTPNFLLRDTLQVLFSDMVEEKRGMLEELLAYLDEPEVPLPKITQEVLIVWGEHDQVFPLPLAQRLQEFLGKKARLVVLKEAAHASNIEHPKEYNRAVLNFLLQGASSDQTGQV